MTLNWLPPIFYLDKLSKSLIPFGHKLSPSPLYIQLWSSSRAIASLLYAHGYVLKHRKFAYLSLVWKSLWNFAWAHLDKVSVYIKRSKQRYPRDVFAYFVVLRTQAQQPQLLMICKPKSKYNKICATEFTFKWLNSIRLNQILCGFVVVVDELDGRRVVCCTLKQCKMSTSIKNY